MRARRAVLRVGRVRGKLPLDSVLVSF